MSSMIGFEEVEKRVMTIQGQQILIDRDVAELYGVETKRVNEAVKNNPNKFPEGYVITLDRGELCKLVENFDLRTKRKRKISNSVLLISYSKQFFKSVDVLI